MQEAIRGINAEIVYKWEHPDNGCLMRKRQHIIRQRFSALGETKEEAKRFTRILAENTPQICSLCKQNYIFLG